jgi:type II secretory pathway pseudopilin PulG
MARKSRAGRIGYALFDAMLFVAILCVLSLIVGPVLRSSQVKADLRLMELEGATLYEAFAAYYEQHREYPNAYAHPELQIDTLDPLSRRGYYKGGITQFLLNQRIDAYDSPDDQGNNREFWVEMTLKRDPSIRFLVAHSDDAPLGGGIWRDGVFIYRGGKLEPI